MTPTPIMLILGLLAVGVGTYELYRVRKRGYVSMRGGAKIYYAKNPRLFWINVILIATLTVVGLILVGLSARRYLQGIA
jgi:hypothetical protein